MKLARRAVRGCRDHAHTKNAFGTTGQALCRAQTRQKLTRAGIYVTVLDYFTEVNVCLDAEQGSRSSYRQGEGLDWAAIEIC